jgi:ADP-glucose pyrophosphorylase
MEQILVILLAAGGVGERLHRLTRDHAKPAMVFGGTPRLIDVPFPTAMNSGLRYVFIQTWGTREYSKTIYPTQKSAQQCTLAHRYNILT